MKAFFPILLWVCFAPQPFWGQSPPAATPAAAKSLAPATKAPAAKTPAPQPAMDNDAIQNSDQAKSIVEQGIKALGGDTYLNIRDREQQGRSYGFHAGRATDSGIVFWSFAEFPDKERFELTKERDVTELYVGDKGYEITYKGAHPMDKKDLDPYLRRRQFSLDTVLRTWVNDPGVILIYEGNAIAAQHPAVRVTLINSKNESVSLFFDSDTHLPVKKSFEWRDPVDRQKNLEEEIYENYRPVAGIMAPFNITRYFNGDMASQRFLNSVTINQGLDQAMFDPNSGYNPNKPQKSSKK